MSAWTDPKLAYLYLLAEAYSENEENDESARWSIRRAMRDIEQADKHVEQRKRDAA
jgi:NRPS condensation-like uncharacterized protein